MRPSHGIASTALGVLIATALLAGCGSSSSEQSGMGASGTGSPAGTAKTSTAPAGAAQTSTAPIGASARSCATNAEHADGLRVSGGVACGDARSVMAGWVRGRGGECVSPAGASRTSCTIDGWRCLGTRTERGIAVSCAQPGRSLSFVARRG